MLTDQELQISDMSVMQNSNARKMTFSANHKDHESMMTKKYKVTQRKICKYLIDANQERKTSFHEISADVKSIMDKIYKKSERKFCKSLMASSQDEFIRQRRNGN